MANKYRGEVDLTIAGKTFTPRLTMDRIMRIEDQLGSIVSLAMRMAQGQAKFMEVVKLIELSIANDKGDAPLTTEQVTEAVLESGLGAVIPALSELLLVALRGRPKEEDKKGKNEAAVAT